jgi:contractile injection system tube protein
MAEFPGSPRLLKGALALYDTDKSTSPATVVVFQYNPEQVRRTLANRTPPQQPGGGGQQGAREDVLRVAGPPVESINVSVVLNATDQLEQPDKNPDTAEKGLYPALAALELAMYPPSLNAEELERKAAAGEVQVEPAHLPLTVLMWGGNRVVPVSITSFSVTEEMFDPRLNPIRAKVDLGLKVLTFMEFPGKSVGRDAYIAYQKKKEQLAKGFIQSTDSSRIRTFLPAGR